MGDPHNMLKACLFLSLLICFDSIQAQSITTSVAGGKIRSGVSAQAVAIDSISGIAVDSAGNVVFCETSRNVIRRVRTDGTIETIAGTGESGYNGDGGPATGTLLFAPAYPRFDSKGNLYFADVSNYRIRRIDSSGTITTVVGTGIRNLFLTDLGPNVQDADLPSAIGLVSDLAIDKSGNLYWAESGSEYQGQPARIRRLTVQGNIEKITGDSAFRGPLSIALDSKGRLCFLGYVSVLPSFGSLGSRSVGRINSDGSLETLSSFIAYSPFAYEERAIVVDLSDSIYFPNYFNNGDSIKRLDPSGSVTTVASAYGINDYFRRLTSLALDASGNIYFADSYSFGHFPRIGQSDSTGVVKVIAGANPGPAPAGTPALQSWFLAPTAITVAPNGDLYIAEGSTGSGCRVRKIGAKQVLETVAGTGNCAETPPKIGGSALSTDLPIPYSIAVDHQGKLYIGEVFGVIAVDNNGTVSQAYRSNLNNFVKLAVDSRDYVYLNGGALQNQIIEIHPDGTNRVAYSLPPVLSEYAYVTALAVGPDDSLYVGTAIGNISKLPDLVTSVQTILFGSPVKSLAIGNTGNAWFIGGAGWICRDVGGFPLGTRGGFSGDGGPSVASAYNTPVSLARAPNDDLYFLDQGNNRVRKFSSATAKPAPAISPGGVVNSASLMPGPIAPGELLTIYGSNFGSDQLQTAAAKNNSISTVLNDVRVRFNGRFDGAGAIIAVTSTQINVVVPYLLAGFPPVLNPGDTVFVVVEVDGIESAPVQVQFAPTAPALYSADGSGSGQGAILNQDGSMNSGTNPEAPGSVITLFGTGEGFTNPALPNGALVVSTPYSVPISPASVTIGGKLAEVLYAGAAPTLVTGVLQIDARIPMGVASGDVPVSLAIGSATATRQITVAVR